jgi:lysophospholipase L1-like esterase
MAGSFLRNLRVILNKDESNLPENPEHVLCMAKMTKAKTAVLTTGIVILIASSGLIVLFFGNLENRALAHSLIRVACVGDSITEGSGYPADLQIMLGANYDVGNFGVSGSSVLLTSDRPYMKQTACQKSKIFQPSIVIIMLGTNDASATTCESIGNFSADYKKLISEYQALTSNPEIWLVKPPPILENDLELNDTNLKQDVIPQIEQVANELQLPIIDVNAILTNYPEYFMDGVHLSSEGATLIANEVNQAITVNGVTATPF